MALWLREPRNIAQQASESIAGKGWRLPQMAAKVWNLGEDLDEGLRLCYGRWSTCGKGFGSCERCAGKARPHVEQNPVTHCRLVVQPHVRKLNDPGALVFPSTVDPKRRRTGATDIETSSSCDVVLKPQHRPVEHGVAIAQPFDLEAPLHV